MADAGDIARSMPAYQGADYLGQQLFGGRHDATNEEIYKSDTDTAYQKALADPTLKALYDKSLLASGGASRYGNSPDQFTKSSDVQNLIDFYTQAGQKLNAAPKANFNDPEFGRQIRLGNSQYGGVATDQYVDALKNRLQELQLTDKTDQNRADLGNQLDTQLGSLQDQVNQHKTMLDQRLGDMLKEYGLTAAMQNQKIGAAYADRGLNRSTFAQNAVNQNMLNSQQAAGNARLATDEAKTGYQNLVDQQKQAVENQKKTLGLQTDIGNTDAFQKYQSDLAENATKQMYQNQEFMKQMNAQQQQEMNQNLQGLVQTGATLALLL